MLAVFDRRNRKIITPTAVLGIRGTGIYIEAEPKRTYVCTCYGIVDIEAKATPDVRETVKTNHHESPRFVYGSGSKQFIVKAPVVNHTDAELILLEEFVGRQPPFVTAKQNGGY